MCSVPQSWPADMLKACIRHSPSETRGAAGLEVGIELCGLTGGAVLLEGVSLQPTSPSIRPNTIVFFRLAEKFPSSYSWDITLWEAMRFPQMVFSPVSHQTWDSPCGPALTII